MDAIWKVVLLAVYVSVVDIPIIFACQVTDPWRHKSDLWRHRCDTASSMSSALYALNIQPRCIKTLQIRRWWRSHAATINSFGDTDSWSWKIMEFPKIWLLTCHNWVKYWPRTKNNTTKREYSAREIRCFFPRSSTTLRLETPRGVLHQPGEGGETPYPGEG